MVRLRLDKYYNLSTYEFPASDSDPCFQGARFLGRKLLIEIDIPWVGRYHFKRLGIHRREGEGNVCEGLDLQVLWPDAVTVTVSNVPL